MDHRHCDIKVCACLARGQPKPFWIQAYFQDKGGGTPIGYSQEPHLG
jgi:hypothetical protein